MSGGGLVAVFVLSSLPEAKEAEGKQAEDEGDKGETEDQKEDSSVPADSRLLVHAPKATPRTPPFDR